MLIVKRYLSHASRLGHLGWALRKERFVRNYAEFIDDRLGSSRSAQIGLSVS